MNYLPSKKDTGFKIRTYELNNWGVDSIEGTFYAAKLQQMTQNQDQLYWIQNCENKKPKTGRKKVLVKWLYWAKN